MSRISGRRFNALKDAAWHGLQVLEDEVQQTENALQHSPGVCERCDEFRKGLEQRRRELQFGWEALFLLNDRYGKTHTERKHG